MEKVQEAIKTIRKSTGILFLEGMSPVLFQEHIEEQGGLERVLENIRRAAEEATRAVWEIRKGKQLVDVLEELNSLEKRISPYIPANERCGGIPFAAYQAISCIREEVTKRLSSFMDELYNLLEL
ncbi:MAG TPA: hypothetical protein ENF51_01950 [Candidatus Aenigmarchaeota archaeon]|nr:hypothetical protein [Candidatus Aenigmarchaeota archaeon]